MKWTRVLEPAGVGAQWNIWAMPATGQQDQDVTGGGAAGDTGQLCRQWTSGGGEGHQAGAGGGQGGAARGKMTR
jgi:hypothetical protein